MVNYLKVLLFLTLLTGCERGNEATDNSSKPTLSSGIIIENMDTTVRPQDDFNRYVNGAWIKNAEIPDDRIRWGVFSRLREESERNHSLLSKRFQFAMIYWLDQMNKKLVTYLEVS